MKQFILLLIIFLSATTFHGQNLYFNGNVKDTAASQGLPNVLMMAVKFKDSSLVSFTRTNKEGVFKSLVVPLDTYIVILSHPKFNDKTYLLVPSADSVYNFKNVVLPSKSIELNEIEILAYKDKVYYKGDTLMFTADSFKTRPNANVEDLLRKLPGVKVDAMGKITVQGKAVDQVLVDGDEFFGSDPTVATRNLNAKTLESVQVFDKKKDNTEGEGNTDEMLKVMNLKLKEDAKKGYFGKISGASDFNKFHENDLLVNRFKKNLKISAFGLWTSTPKQAFDWSDAYKYGINDNGNVSFDPESNSWTSFEDNKSGIPTTLKSGFYFNNKFGKSTKVNADYTFRQTGLLSGSEVNTQYFLDDTTYTNQQLSSNNNQNLSHNFNFKLSTKLDSLTELIVRPKGSLGITETSNLKIDDFVSEEGTTTRRTSILNNGKTEKTDADILMKINRNFKKKDRQLSIMYNPTLFEQKGKNNLNTDFVYFQSQLKDSSIAQQRETSSLKNLNNGSLTYTEPWSKKLKSEFSYGISHSLNANTRKTFDFGGQTYDLFNTLQSNDFRNTRLTNRGGTRLTYEVKKYKIGVGVNYKNIYQENINVTDNQKLNKTFTGFLPYANAQIRFSQSSNLWMNYYSDLQTPELSQMQPVVDNSDPNRIFIGNPDLKPAFVNNLNMNYYFYKGISDVHFNVGIYGSQTFNQFTNTSYFDSLGRAIATPTNINGNYYGNTWLGGGFPILHRWLKIEYRLNANINRNLSYVNNKLNTVESYGFAPELTIEKQIEWMELGITGEYKYDNTKQTISINSNQNYYSYSGGANLSLKLPKKFYITSDVKYTNNGNRTPGFNLEVTTINATISKAFFKRDALTVVLEGYDLLNQNVNNTRYVNSNSIVDSKTQVIKRFFLFRLIYKFTSQKEEEEEEDDF
ncbi:MAG: outer membrane beta-barrel protein [Sphingobacteriaceae bacterium]|nr:outer membrane beta-barrel protein [Sphingobacteriaceae bacterium]